MPSKERKKARALFKFAGTNYNLGVTDPPYESKIKDLQMGFHKSSDFGYTRRKSFAVYD
jgi:hypothetical protein